MAPSVNIKNVSRGVFSTLTKHLRWSVQQQQLTAFSKALHLRYREKSRQTEYCS